MIRSERSALSNFSAASVRQVTVASSVFFSFISMASAQTAGAPGGNPLMQLIPFVVIFGVMYFFMIRPQMKRQKEHQALLGNLKRGDEVLTSGGILGRIEGLTDQFATLEIASGVRVKILRTQIAGLANTTAPAGEVKT